MGKNSSKYQPGIQIILSIYLRAQPRRQSEREMFPTRNPFPVQAKRQEIPKKINKQSK